MSSRLVGAFVILDGRVLLGLRHPDRSEYPSTWDMIGGHVEANESAPLALRRELAEELGIDVEPGEPMSVVMSDHPDFELTIWRVDQWTGTIANSAPDEHVELRWFAIDDIDGLAFPHPNYPALIEQALEARWDPVMAGICPPHITVVYPEEVTDEGLLIERAAQLIPTISPFDVAIGEVVGEDDGCGGVFAEVEDRTGQLASLRDTLLAAPQHPLGYPFHTTIAHPRTSADPVACWQQLRGVRLDLTVRVDEILYTATSDTGRSTLAAFCLSQTCARGGGHALISAANRLSFRARRCVRP